MRFWLSWIERSPDFRPMRCPPNGAVLAWWRSGSGDGFSASVALAEAPTEAKAWAAIAKDWPAKRREKRFCDEVADDWRPPGDRFPLKGWAAERVAAGRKALEAQP